MTLLSIYEEGLRLFKKESYDEAQTLLQEGIDSCESSTSRSPQELILEAFARTLIARCMLVLNKDGSKYSFGQVQSPLDPSIQQLKQAAEIFYNFGAERYMGHILPFCGSLMLEASPSVGFSTIYDGLYRLRNSGAPLKAESLRESMKLLHERTRIHLQFRVDRFSAEEAEMTASQWQAIYELGQCLLLEGKREESLPFVQESYDGYKSQVEILKREKQSSVILEMWDMTLNFLRWSLAYAKQDQKGMKKERDYAAAMGNHLPEFPGEEEVFPAVPPLSVDLHTLPPLDFLSDLHLPFSSALNAAEYARLGVRILGSYGNNIPEESLNKARDLLGVALDIYKEKEQWKDAADISICLVEATIRSEGEGAHVTELTNFAFKHLSKENEDDESMLQYLKSMVTPKKRD